MWVLFAHSKHDLFRLGLFFKQSLRRSVCSEKPFPEAGGQSALNIGWRLVEDVGATLGYPSTVL